MEQEIIMYDQEFRPKIGGIYKLPDFLLTYVDNYQDSVPEDFPNPDSGLFRGKLFTLEAGDLLTELKVPDGSGLLTDRHFDFAGFRFTLQLNPNTDGVIFKIIRD